jgi:hypothetical protein
MRRILVAGLVGLAFGAVVALAPPARAAGETYTQIGLSGGGTESALWRDPGQAKAAIILLPGGDGIVHIAPDGSLHNGNFLVRSRRHWAGHGIATLLLDTPNGDSLFGNRSTADYADAVGRAVAFVRAHTTVPIWLVGTSQGTIAAANAAARLPAGQIAGVVLTSSVTRMGKSGETVFSTDLGTIAQPVLVVSNAADRCAVSPPGGDEILAALKRSPRKAFIMLHGGTGGGDQCEAMAGHGFIGIEPLAISTIADWMAAGK